MAGRSFEIPLDALRSFPWERYVRFAFFFGQPPREVFRSDLDIAVSDIGLEALGELLAELAKRLSLPEDYIDIVVGTERTPCPLVLEALKGVPPYVPDWDEVYGFFNVCQDQQIDTRKLKLLETALEAIWRR